MTKAEEVLQQLKIELPDMPYFNDDNLEILWSEYGQVSEHVQTGDKHRWYTKRTTIWEFNDNSFLGIEWNEGNTENQENEGPLSVFLVEPYVVTTTKYRRIDGS